MTTAARSWLPGSAIADAARDVPVVAAIDDWSAAWFVAASAMAVAAPARSAAAGAGAGWTNAAGLLLDPAPDASDRICAALFGQRDDGEEATRADDAALLAVSEACLTDLRVRLGIAFDVDGGDAWRPAFAAGDAQPRWTWRILARDATLLVQIAADDALLARRRIAALPPTVVPPPLASVAQALAAERIDVSAFVGRARLTTAELGGLGEGDVVVLDRALDDRLALAVERRAQPLACTIHDSDGALALKLVA